MTYFLLQVPFLCKLLEAFCKDFSNYFNGIPFSNSLLVEEVFARHIYFYFDEKMLIVALHAYARNELVFINT